MKNWQVGRIYLDFQRGSEVVIDRQAIVVRRVLCKNSSAVKAAIHAGLAEKWSWNFIQKSVIENDVF